MSRRVQLALVTTLLAWTSAAHAQEASTRWTLQGSDSRRGAATGTLVVSPRADRAFDVDLQVAYGAAGAARFGGTATGSGRQLTGTLRVVTGLADVVQGDRGGEASFSVSFELTEGRCQGVCVTSGATLSFRGERPTPALSGWEHEARSPAAQRDAVFAEVSAVPYGALPRVGSRGVGSHLWDTISALRLGLLERTFATASDERAPRTKIFHPFGSVAKVRYEARGGHPYTGLFETGGEGLARLSLATDEKTYIPGIAMKLFVQGGPSVNVHAIPSFDPQTSRDFFERAPSNEIPPPSNVAIKLFSKLARRIADPLRRPVDHLAAVRPDGACVSDPVAPRRIHFRPAEVHFPADSTADFRDLLATIPAGTVIYAVHAETPEGEVHIGDVRTCSPFVASEWGDRVLHFQHAR